MQVLKRLWLLPELSLVFCRIDTPGQAGGLPNTNMLRPDLLYVANATGSVITSASGAFSAHGGRRRALVDGHVLDPRFRRVLLCFQDVRFAYLDLLLLPGRNQVDRLRIQSREQLV